MTEQIEEWLIGIRLRDTVPADDFKLVEDLPVTVGDIVLVETGSSTALGEIRRPRRAVPDFKRDRLFRRVVRIATDAEAREYRDRRQREERAIATASAWSRQPRHGDEGGGRRDARSRAPGDRLLQRRGPHRLPRPGARSRPRVPGPRGDAAGRRAGHDARDGRHRPVRASALLLVASRKFDPISVKMAKAQDMPLTDSRLLGNCGRLKCCLLYEFSTYQELRARLPRVNSPCQASCGGSGCMTGKVRSVRVLSPVGDRRLPRRQPGRGADGPAHVGGAVARPAVARSRARDGQGPPPGQQSACYSCCRERSLLPHDADLLHEHRCRTWGTPTRRSWPTRWPATIGSPATTCGCSPAPTSTATRSRRPRPRPA